MSTKDSSRKGKVDAVEDTDDIDFEGQDDDNEGPEETNPHADITLLLKELAEHPDEAYEQIAQEMEIPADRANKTINDFVKFLIGTHREPDFPERMRAHYNSLVKLDRNKLTGKDMMTLMSLINKFHAKLIAQKATPRERDKLNTKMANMNVPGVVPPVPHQQQQQQQQPQPQQQVQVQQPVTFTDPYANLPPQFQQQQGQQGQQQQQQQQQEESWAPYDNEESLMKFLLESNVAIKDPQRIRQFMQMYRWMKNEFTNTPQKLLVLLKSSFPPSAAEAVYLAYMDMKAQVSDDPGNLWKITGASNYRPVSPNLEQLIAGNNPALRAMINENLRGGRPYGSGQPQMGQNPNDAYGDSAFDRQLDRMQKMITMTLMQNMANNSMGGKPGGGGMGDVGGMGFNPNDYDMYEDYGNDGRVTGRRYIRKAGVPFGYGPPGYPPQYPGQGNPQADKSTEMMMEFIKMTTQASNADRQLLMQKLLSNDSQGVNDIVGTILKQAVGVIGANSDPIQGLNKTMELADRMNQIRRPDQPKTLEEKKMELDFILARKDMERSDLKESREFERQREESRSADDRIGHIIDGLAGAAKDVLTPAVQAVTQSFGAGLAGRMGVPPGAGGVGVPGMPPQGYPPGYAQQQQVPPQKVIIREVPAPIQPIVQPVPQQQYAQQQQQPSPDEIAMAQQQEQIRREQELAQMEAQQDNRPLDEQLKDFADEEIDGLALKMEGDMIHNERAFHKVLAERNRRRLRSGGQPLKQPERRYVSPVAQGIAQHEAQQELLMQQQNQPQPTINVFDDDKENEPYPGPNPNIPEPTEEQVLGINPNVGVDESAVLEPTSAVPSAPDLSDAYDNDDIRESLRLSGQLQDTDDDSRIGIPSTSTSSVPYSPTSTENEPQEEQAATAEEEEVTYDANDIDENNDTVVEG